MRDILSVVVLAAATWVFGAGVAEARPAIRDAWKGVYEDAAGPCATPSQSALNVLQGTGTECQLCHLNTNGGEPWNGYGWSIRTLIQSGSSVLDAFLGAEPEDSDGDPGVADNLAEVCASSQPGWTEGANNTIYCKGPSINCGGDSILVSQEPPPGILGTLDLASVSCEIVLDQQVYTTGDTVTAQVFRLSNSMAGSVAMELKTWFEFPDANPTAHIRLGADGSIVPPAGFDIDLGPLALTTVTDGTPRGASAYNCRWLDPVTGESRSLDINSFEVQ